MLRSRVGVLISGRGSNLQALIDAIADGSSTRNRGRHLQSRGRRRARARAARRHRGDRASSHRGLAVARRRTIARSRASCRRATSASSASPASCGCVGAPLLDAFPNAILNIHPSLLPAFPGVDAQRQAIEHGVKVSGVTVHLVTRGARWRSDRRAAQPCRCSTTTRAETLAARILVEEHRAYPEAVQAGARTGGWTSRRARRFAQICERRRFSVTIATSGGQLIRTGT